MQVCCWGGGEREREERDQRPAGSLATGGPALLTGFPMLLMSNCRGTPLGTFFSTVSTTAGTEVAAGGCRVQAEGGLYGVRTTVSVSDQDTMTANSHSNVSRVGVCLILLLTPAGSWLWDCQWR